MTTDQTPPKATDEEVATLRAQVAELQTQLNERPEAPPARGHWVRTTAVVVLMAIGFLLTPVSIASIWLRNTVYDTDTYVQTVAPLAQNPAVTDAVSAKITASIFEQVDVESLLQQNLPPNLAFAAGPLSGQIQSQTNGVVKKALQTSQFQDLWDQVNRTASTELVAFLEADQPSAVSVQNGALVLDLGPIIDQVKQQLVAQGFSLASKIPSVSKSVTLPVANIDAIVKARQAANTMRTLSYVFPIVALLCFALAVFLSRDRRRALIWVGALIALGAVTSGVSLALGRSTFLAQRPGTVFDAPTAANMFDTLSRFMRTSNRVTFFVGVLLALVAAFSGPYPWAVKTRGVIGGAITEGGQRTGWNTGPVGAWFDRHRRGWMLSLAIVYAVVVVIWDRPTPMVLLWLLVAALVLLAVGLFIAATAPREEADAERAKAEEEVTASS